MAYVIPTPEDVKARFPVLEPVDDDVLQQIIDEAQRFVGTNWTELDYKPAIQYLAAHMAVKEGLINQSGMASAGLSSGVIQSETLGDASITYAKNDAISLGGFTGNDTDLASTPYGLRYLALRRANVGGPLVV